MIFDKLKLRVIIRYNKRLFEEAKKVQLTWSYKWKDQILIKLKLQLPFVEKMILQVVKKKK